MEKTIDYYNLLGVPSECYLKDGKVLDLYQILGFSPQVDLNGSRKLSPYEILSVPPQIKNGVERPIVYAIKNKIKKIAKIVGVFGELTYKKQKSKHEDNSIESLAQKYKRAVLLGNNAEAEELFAMINSLSGGEGEAYLDSFYDYTKFYRRMKKQLIIDIFAHFFMMYMSLKKSIVKNGIVKEDKIYKPFKEKDSLQQESKISQPERELISSINALDLSNIASFSMDEDDFEVDSAYLSELKKEKDNDKQEQVSQNQTTTLEENNQLDDTIYDDKIIDIKITENPYLDIENIMFDEQGRIFIKDIKEQISSYENENITDEPEEKTPNVEEKQQDLE